MDISNQEKLWKLNLLFLLGAVALSACSLDAQRVRSIQVASAIYSVEDGTIPCDVTARVGGICNGLASCTVSVQSALCHMGDPAPPLQKLLSVHYSCHAAGTLRATAVEGKTLTLVCLE